MAWLAAADGDPNRAADELRRILESGDPDELVVPHALAALAVLCAAAGETTQANALASRAIDAAARFELLGIQVMALVRAAQAHTLCLHSTGTGEAALREVLASLFDRTHRANLRHFVAECFELAAVVSDRADSPEEAARYLGASDALRTARAEQSPSIPALGALVDHTRLRTRAALGESAFATITAEASATPTRNILADIRTHLQ